MFFASHGATGRSYHARNGLTIGAPQSGSSTPNRAAPFGVGVDCVSNALEWHVAGGTASTDCTGGSRNITLVTTFLLDATAANQYIAGFCTSGTTLFQTNQASGTFNWTVRNSANAIASASLSGFVAGVPYVSVARLDTTNNAMQVWLYGNGQLRTATNTPPGGTYNIGGVSLAHLNRGSGVELTVDGWIGDHATFDIALTDAECISLATNPWQLFEPRRILIPVTAAASTYTLSAPTYTPGSITASGVQARVTVTAA